jgi:hypothetical protein
MSFRADLELGEEYQRRFLYLIEYDECKIAKGNFKEWDIWIRHQGEEVLFEVKCDRKAQTTGNLAIEFECSGKPSGVNATHADFWIHFVQGHPMYYMIPIADLKQAIADKKYIRTVKGGDGWRSNMYLFPMHVFDDFKEMIPAVFREEYKW